MSDTERYSETRAVRDPAQDELETLASGEHSDPFQVLGPHLEERNGRSTLVIRALHPGAIEAEVVNTSSGASYKAERIHPAGLFEAAIAPGTFPAGDGLLVDPASYQVRLRFAEGGSITEYDPYAFPPQIADGLSRTESAENRRPEDSPGNGGIIAANESLCCTRCARDVLTSASTRDEAVVAWAALGAR